MTAKGQKHCRKHQIVVMEVDVKMMIETTAPAEWSLLSGSRLGGTLDAFLDAQDVVSASKAVYRSALKSFLGWLRAQNIEVPTKQTILNYKMGLREKGLSPATISGALVAIRLFFNWLEESKGLPNIARGIKGIKRAKGFRKDALSIGQVKALLMCIDRSTFIGLRDYAIINLLVRTGIRTIEAVRANIGDIRQQNGPTLLWIRGKGRQEKDEFVVLTADALTPIQDFLRLVGNRKISAPLFPSLSDRNSGSRLTTRTIRKIVKDRLRAIGIDDNRLSAHSLRHTSISLSLQAGATVQEAQAMARHADIKTTMAYAHNVERLKNAPEKKISALLAA